MTRGEPELWSQLARADAMDHGETQQALMEDVVRHADAAGFHRLAFAARRALASAYSVDRQWHKAFPLFARCLSDYDARPWRFGPEEDWALRRWYTHIAQSMAEFPEIPLEQVYGAFTDMERRFRAGGHGLRDVHAARRWVAQLAGDWAEEERCHRQWIAAGGPDPASVWDVEAEIERLVLRGDAQSLDVARELAAPVLAGEVRFDEPSAPIQCLMLLPLARAGRHAEAARAYRRADRALADGVYRYEYSGMLVEFCALTGNESVGLADLRPRLHGFPTLNRPNGKMEFAASAAVLLDRLVGDGRGAELVGCSCGEEPEVPIARLRDEMVATALDLAARFDARNGTTCQGDRIRARLAARPVVDHLPLTPTSRRPARIHIPRGLAPEQLLDRAEWHARGDEVEMAQAYLAAVSDPAPHLRGRVAELRALLERGPAGEALLREAIEAHRAVGDVRRHLLARTWLGRLLAEDGRGEEGLRVVTGAVEEMHRAGDPWGAAHGELRRAQVLLLQGDPAHYAAIERAGRCAAASRDPQAVGLVADLEAYWRRCDGADPALVIRLATTATDALVAAGAHTKTITAWDTLRAGHVRAGTEDAFLGAVTAQLAALPPYTPGQVRAHLHWLRGRALLAAGDPAAAVADLTEAVAENGSRDDDTAEQWYHLAEACHAAGRYDDAVSASSMGAAWLYNLRKEGALDDPGWAVRCRWIAADSHRQLGEAAAALEQYARLVDDAREFDDHATLPAALTELADVLGELDRHAEAAELLREAADGYSALEDPRLVVESRSAEATQHHHRGDADAALGALALAEQAARGMPAEPASAVTLGRLHRNAAGILAGLDRPVDAVHRAERGAAAFRQAGEWAGAVELELFRAALFTRADRPDLAEPVLRATLDECPDPEVGAGVAEFLADTLERLGRGREAAALRAELPAS
ncbi:MAG TPA: tetratricopeptide repeat protein [Pseudonocardia sp.]|nr:tetratricopeptide repeat protein [Pseudonocardia sp.]